MVYVNKELEDKFKNQPAKHINIKTSVTKVKKKGRVRTAKADGHTILFFGRNLTLAGQMLIFSMAFVLCMGVLLVAFRQPIKYWYYVKTSKPSIVKLAKDADMSEKGTVLFLQTHPQVDQPTQFDNDCPTATTNNAGTSVLGCYIPTTNRIYLLTMPSQLYAEEVATAAYEMLHPVYISLSKTAATPLNQSIESNYNTLQSDPNLSGQVTTFATTEPGARDLELFSILCTEYSDSSLTTSLVNYCSPYFNDDMNSVVADNNQIDNLFTSNQSQLTSLQNSYNNYVNEANTANKDANTAYYDSTTWAAAGNEEENDYNYNIYVQDLDDYNNDVDSINNTANQYNQLLSQNNDLVTAISGGQPVNQLQTEQQQTATNQ